MPITVPLHELKHTLDVTSHVIREANNTSNAPILQRVHLTRVRSGFIAESIDRYTLIRSFVLTENERAQLGDVETTPRGIKKRLSRGRVSRAPSDATP